MITLEYVGCTRKKKMQMFVQYLSISNLRFTPSSKHLQILHSDNGTKYFNSTSGDYLWKKTELFIKIHVLIPHNKIELSNEKNRHLLEVACVLMITMNMSKIFWEDVIWTSAHLINWMSCQILSFETLKKFQSFFPTSCLGTHLPLTMFGCTALAFVHYHSPQCDKLELEAHKCIFIGYSPTTKGYKYCDPSICRVFVSLDVKFFENIPYFWHANLQGETSNENWCNLNFDLYDPSPLIILPNHHMLCIEGNLNLEGDLEPRRKEILVYSWKPKTKYNEAFITEALKNQNYW